MVNDGKYFIAEVFIDIKLYSNSHCFILHTSDAYFVLETESMGSFSKIQGVFYANAYSEGLWDLFQDWILYWDPVL